MRLEAFNKELEETYQSLDLNKYGATLWQNAIYKPLIEIYLLNYLRFQFNIKICIYKLRHAMFENIRNIL